MCCRLTNSPPAHGVRRVLEQLTPTLVGVSLLAMAVHQPPKIFNVPTLSRAGSLLQGSAVFWKTQEKNDAFSSIRVK